MSQDPKQKEKKTPKYSAERVIGSGSFGIVYQAVCTVTKETVAIKKVLEDRRYKNRELAIMKQVKHPNVVSLLDCFYSRHSRKKSDIYLNLVMEYVPDTLYNTVRAHARAKQTIPFFTTKLYAYQICRAVAYLHARGICHRDIKPQNLLLDPDKNIVKLCDFGSAKMLKEGEPNVAYICSRYYRAPELIFESSHYKTTIDIWSLGCVVAEMYLGTPLYQGGSGVDQLVEIIKILGAPTKEEIMSMNPNYRQYRFPAVKPLPWAAVFSTCTWNNKPVPADGIDLISKMLVFTPAARVAPFDALSHPFFDEIREEGRTLPNGKPLPPLFNFTEEELRLAQEKGTLDSLMPAGGGGRAPRSMKSKPKSRGGDFDGAEEPGE